MEEMPSVFNDVSGIPVVIVLRLYV